METETEEKMIWVIRLEFYDGSKFYVRTDRADWQELINKMRREKGTAFMELPTVRQIELKNESYAKLGGLMRLTQIRMSESEYLKVPLI